jgi:hypothetical protein
VCKSSREAGGPRRCSSDARGALQESTATLASLESQRAAAQTALTMPAPTVALQGPRPAVPRCFFCDDLATAAAHMTRRGKICCHQCWPDSRLTEPPGGGL